MKYYIIAGEASGDLHGSNLIKGLRAEDGDAAFRLWGGGLMSGAATEGTALTAADVLVRDYSQTAVMGISDVLAKLGQIGKNLEFCRKDILGWSPDVVILIDYPGFNMKVAEFCHRKGVKVFYYIAPKTWASRESRNRRLKRYVDRLFIVFPFEIPYFTQRAIPFEYHGNPLVDAVDNHIYERPAKGRYLAVLAGSRKGEISRMMPVCMEVADRLKMQVVIAGAPSRCSDDYTKYIGERKNVKLVFGRTYDVLKYADAAIINSGTASLEAALIGTPQVVCWSASRLTFWVARHLFRVQDHVRFISLGNLIIDRGAFRELIQDDFNAPELCGEVRRLLEDDAYRKKMAADYADIRAALGGTGASRSVARAMIDCLVG